MGLRFYIRFEGDATYTEITEYVKYDSVDIDVSLMNDKFKATQDTLSAVTIYDKWLADKFFTATTWLPAYVTNDLQESRMYGYDANKEYGYDTKAYGFLDVGRIFTGAVYPNTEETLKDYPSEGVSFEIVDNSYLLDVDNTAFSIPEVFGDTYHVFNPSVPNKSLMHLLLQQTGLQQEAIDDTYAILEEVSPMIFEGGDSTVSKLVNEILYEYHHVCYFDENGMFRLYNWKHDTLYIDSTIEESNIADSNGIKRNRNILDYDGYKAISYPISTAQETLVYRDTFDEDGKLLLPTQAYPTEGELKDIKQKYSNDWLPDDAEIVATYNHVLEKTVDSGIDVVTEVYEKEQAQIVLKNNSTEDKYIKQFDIRASIYYTDGEEELFMPADLTKSEEIELKYIHDNAQVQNFAEALYNNTIKYGQYSYTFNSTKQYSVGVAYNITTRDYSVDVLMIARKHNDYDKIYEYKCIGVGENIAQIGGGSYMKPSYNPSYVPPKTPSVFYSILNNVSEFPTASTPATQGHIYIHGYTSEQVASDVDGRIRYPDPNNATFFVDIPKQSIDLTDTVFWNVEVDRDFWTYLVLDNSTITPAYYSIADAVFYDKYSNVVTQGIIIGQVKVGTIAPAHDTATIWESEPFDIGRTLASIQTAQTADAFKYLSQANTPEEFGQYASNLGITDFFTTMAVWELFTEKIKTNQLQVGDGTKTSGFVFYAIDDNITGEKTIEAWSDGIKIFDINPNNGNVTIGNYENENGVRWVDTSKEFVFKGTGKFTGEIQHDSLYTRESDNSGETINTPSKTRFLGESLYNNLTNISSSTYTSSTGTIDNIAIESISKQDSVSSLRQIWYANYSSNYYAFYSPLSATVRIDFNAKAHFPSGNDVKLFVNGEKLASLYLDSFHYNSSTYVYVNIKKGDEIRITQTDNESQWIQVRVYDVGVIIKKTSTDMEFIKPNGYYNYNIKITSPDVFDSTNYYNYISGKSFINNAHSLVLGKSYSTDTGNSFLIIEGTQKTVSSITKLQTEMRIFFTDGKVQTIVIDESQGANIGWYNISGSIKLLVTTSAILTKDIIPQDNTLYNLGYKGTNSNTDKRFNNLYLSNNLEGGGDSKIIGFDEATFKKINIVDTMLPSGTPILGGQSISGSYTPSKGIYNASIAETNRAPSLFFSQTAGMNYSANGVFSGTSATSVRLSGITSTWYYAKF